MEVPWVLWKPLPFSGGVLGCLEVFLDFWKCFRFLKCFGFSESVFRFLEVFLFSGSVYSFLEVPCFC